MRCPNCFYENDDNEVTCVNCGVNLRNPEEKISAEDYIPKKKSKTLRTIVIVLIGCFVGRLIGGLAGKAVGSMLVKDNDRNQNYSYSVSIDRESIEKDLKEKGEEFSEAVEKYQKASAALEEYQKASEEYQKASEVIDDLERMRSMIKDEDNEADKNATKSSTDAESKSATESSEASQEVTAAIGQLAYGTVNNDCYESMTLGYGIQLDGWTIYNRKALAELDGYKGEIPDEASEFMKKNKSFTDLHAVASDELQIIDIQIHEMKAMFGMTISQKEWEELLPDVVSQMKSSVENKLTVKSADAQLLNVDLEGITYPAIQINTIFISGVKTFQKQLYMTRGDYLVIITITTYNSDKTNDVLDCFYSLEN